MRLKKNRPLRILSFILLIIGLLSVILGITYIIKINNEKEEIEIKENEGRVYYNDDIYFFIEDKTLKYVNRQTREQLGKSFPYGVLKIFATKSCNDNSLFQIYVLTKVGKLYVNKYPSAKISSKTYFEFDFIEVETNHKIKDITAISVDGCNTKGVSVVYTNNKSGVVKLQYSNINYNSNNYLLESVEIN